MSSAGDRPTAGRIAVGLAILAAGAAMLAGCGGSSPEQQGRTRAGLLRRPCPGARTCPYERAEVIGRRGEGVLRDPEAIVNGSGDRVYVADQFSHSVQVFSPRGHFEGEWGSFGRGRGQFGAVGGLAVDSSGAVYLVDSTNNRVEKFTGAGRFIASWGSSGSGIGQFHFGAGKGPDMPPGGGIAVSGAHVYVADTENNRIERFALDGSGARVLVGSGTARGKVLGPRGLAASGNTVYVTDEGSDRVQELDSRGAFIAQTGLLRASPNTFTNPFDVAVHAGSVYVVDDNNGRIVKLTRHLRYLGVLTGEGPDRLSKYVRAVAVDRRGRVYVADTGHDRIEVFAATGLPLRNWGTSGEAPGQFVAPLDVATAPTGQLLVVETLGSRSPMYLFSPRLAYQATWSRGGDVIIGRHFFSPYAAAFAPDGTVWVVDRENNLVRHFSATGTFLGLVDGKAPGASAAHPSGFAEPSGVAVDAHGDVIVADTGHGRVQSFSPDGSLLASWRRAGAVDRPFRRPLAVAVSPDGSVYVVDGGNYRIVELDAGGKPIAAWGDQGAGPGRFELPTGIAVDARGRVFVSDRQSDRIQEFTAHGRLLSSWGTEGVGPGELSGPSGITIDCRGDLLVTDTQNNRTQLFTHVASGPPCSGPLRS